MLVAAMNPTPDGKMPSESHSSPKEIQNYRDWTKIDVDLWRHYWFGMVNRGVLAQPYWWDEQWTISVQHTEADIDKHLAVFEEVAPALRKAQEERGLAFVGAAGH